MVTLCCLEPDIGQADSEGPLQIAVTGPSTVQRAPESVSDQRVRITWSYDFVHERIQDGRGFRMLNVIDEYSRECLMIGIKRRLN